MKLLFTAEEIKVAKKEFGFSAFEITTKVGHKTILPNGDYEVEIKSEVIFDFIAIFSRVKPTVIAMAAMAKALDNQLADLGKTFSDKWLK